MLFANYYLMEKGLLCYFICDHRDLVIAKKIVYVPICSYDDGMVTGTPALTSRGFIEEDFVKVAEYFDLAVKIALKIKAESQGI